MRGLQTVLPFDAATGQVFPSLTEDWTPPPRLHGADDRHRGRPYLRNAHQPRTTWQVESADDVAATEQVDDLPGYGMPGLILRAAYVKQQTIMIKGPGCTGTLGLWCVPRPMMQPPPRAIMKIRPRAGIGGHPGLCGNDKYWYFDLNELTKE